MGWIDLPQGGDRRPALIGVVCRECHEVFFPPRPVCPNCWSRSLEKKAMGHRGRLGGFAVAHVAPRGFEAPYIQGFIDLDEGPRIFSLIEAEAAHSDGLRKGQLMDLIVREIGTDETGQPIVAWKYKPI